MNLQALAIHGPRRTLRAPIRLQRPSMICPSSLLILLIIIISISTITHFTVPFNTLHLLIPFLYCCCSSCSSRASSGRSIAAGRRRRGVRHVDVVPGRDRRAPIGHRRAVRPTALSVRDLVVAMA